MPSTVSPATSARVDVWIWATRFLKTRSLATAACRAGHVRVNGDRAKAAQPVRIGDEVRVLTDREHTIVVRRILLKRVGAVIAAEAYTDLTPPEPPRVEVPTVVHRDRGAGRPTKRERRDIDRLRGR